MVSLSINETAVSSISFGDSALGAELSFQGVVRGSEAGQPISGIDYVAFLPMAVRLLERIASEGQEEFGTHVLHIHHRIGFVPAGDSSVIIATATPHSKEAFDRTAYYLHRLKTELPIWKHPRLISE